MNTTEKKSNAKFTSLVNYRILCAGLLIGASNLQAQDNKMKKNLRLQNIPKIMKGEDVTTEKGTILMMDAKMKTKVKKLELKKEGELSTLDKDIPLVNGANVMKLRS